MSNARQLASGQQAGITESKSDDGVYGFKKSISEIKSRNDLNYPESCNLMTYQHSAIIEV